MENKTTSYIGITIGPIVNTMMLTSKPAGLWFASYMFSYISRRIYLTLVDGGIGRKDIITPYISSEDMYGEVTVDAAVESAFKEGIGIHHDRIILLNAQGREQQVREAIADAVDMLAQRLAGAATTGASNHGKPISDKDSWKKYLLGYLQIYMVVVEVADGQNPLLEVSNYLDTMEQQKKFVSETNEEDNLLGQIIARKDDNANEVVKNIVSSEEGFAIDINGWQLSIKDRSHFAIKDLEHIANGLAESESRLKLRSYYAFVQADGDNMGALLKSFGGEIGSIHKFSAACIQYALKAKEIISEYGGVTIYAGGDDLCFLAPVKTKNGTIFDLLREIEKCFKECFDEIAGEIKSSEPMPSVSFGVFISYRKFPLYEALGSALSLLETAKEFKTADPLNAKNAIALKIRKHSGQQFGVVFGQTAKQFMLMEKGEGDIDIYADSPKCENELLSPLVRMMRIIKCNENEITLRSLRELLRRSRVLFDYACKNGDIDERRQAVRNLFVNVFDSDEHIKNKEFIDLNCELFLSLDEELAVLLSPDQDRKHSIFEYAVFTKEDHNCLKTMDAILSTIRFFSEEGVK